MAFNQPAYIMCSDDDFTNTQFSMTISLIYSCMGPPNRLTLGNAKGTLYTPRGWGGQVWALALADHRPRNLTFFGVEEPFVVLPNCVVDQRA
jgi:hypothetical protein